MAFGLQYLQRAEISVDLNKISNPVEGQVTGAGPSLWMYNASNTHGSNDSAATVEGAGYFLAAKGYLSVGDVVYVFTNDPGYHLLAVASNTGTALTTAVIA